MELHAPTHRLLILLITKGPARRCPSLLASPSSIRPLPYSCIRTCPSRRAVGCGYHVLRMYQSASTERKTRACTNLCLPRPCAFWSLGTAYNPGRWLVAAVFGPTVSAAGSAAAASVTTVTSASTAAVLTTLCTISFHVVFISTSAISTIGPPCAITIFVLTS